MATKDVTTKMVLQAVRDHGEGKGKIKELLVARTGEPVKVIYRAMMREDGHRRIDYGTWVWNSWLTDKGKADLEQLELGDGS